MRHARPAANSLSTGVRARCAYAGERRVGRATDPVWTTKRARPLQNQRGLPSKSAWAPFKISVGSVSGRRIARRCPGRPSAQPAMFNSRAFACRNAGCERVRKAAAQKRDPRRASLASEAIQPRVSAGGRQDLGSPTGREPAKTQSVEAALPVRSFPAGLRSPGRE
jgi:hypothetical protein